MTRENFLVSTEGSQNKSSQAAPGKTPRPSKLQPYVKHIANERDEW